MKCQHSFYKWGGTYLLPMIIKGGDEGGGGGEGKRIIEQWVTVWSHSYTFWRGVRKTSFSWVHLLIGSVELLQTVKRRKTKFHSWQLIRMWDTKKVEAAWAAFVLLNKETIHLWSIDKAGFEPGIANQWSSRFVHTSFGALFAVILECLPPSNKETHVTWRIYFLLSGDKRSQVSFLHWRFLK